MFEDFLRDEFLKLEPRVLDDHLPDAFDHWLSKLDVEDVIDYANKWNCQ